MKQMEESLYSALCKYIDFESHLDPEVHARDMLTRLKNGAFVSYAQNYEDVMLNRIFRGKKQGFYIDIGAFHPFFKSTTNAFYQAGWNGINIDVSQVNISNFEHYRDRDINICAAIGKDGAEKEFFIVEGTTRSTSLPELAVKYKAEKMPGSFKKVKTVSLTALCELNKVQEIDYISIDVEGSEKDVLESFDLEKFRPKVIVIEATYPETQNPSWHSWEMHLTESGYSCAYFDGLNRFYVHSSSSELGKHFQIPPNYFDDFIKYNDLLLTLSYLNTYRSMNDRLQ